MAEKPKTQQNPQHGKPMSQPGKPGAQPSKPSPKR